MDFNRVSTNQQLQKKEISLSKKEVEEKILEHFNFLKEEGGLHQVFSSYDFRFEENTMKEIWESILDYLFKEIFNNFGVSMGNLKKYTLIKNKIPIGLNNIIQQLRVEQKYITDEDLKDINFYKINFPEIYPQSQGYLSSFLGNLKSIINFTGTKIGCKEENENNNNNLVIRTDITEEDKYKIIPDNQIIFNYEKFKSYSDDILAILMDILQEEDNEIISTNNFIKILKERYLNNKNTDEEQIDQPLYIKYGIEYLNIALFYLEKIKKINLFQIESNNKNFEFIKIPKNPTEPITNKDEAVAKTLSEIELLEKRNSEYEKKIEQMTEKAKAQIKKGNKQSAKTFMIKRKNYQKFLENSQNTLSILEKQIFDIKNAESNANFTEILKKTVEIGKQYGANIDEFADVTEDLKQNKDDLNEIENNIRDLNLMNVGDDEDLDKELKELEESANKKENEKQKEEEEFPSANNDEIIDDKILEELEKEK